MAASEPLWVSGLEPEPSEWTRGDSTLHGEVTLLPEMTSGERQSTKRGPASGKAPDPTTGGLTRHAGEPQIKGTDGTHQTSGQS